MEQSAAVGAPIQKLRKYDDRLLLLLRILHMPAGTAEENCRVGQEVPAGSSFINQVCIPGRVPGTVGGKTSTVDERTNQTYSKESHVIVENGSRVWGSGV